MQKYFNQQCCTWYKWRGCYWGHLDGLGEQVDRASDDGPGSVPDHDTAGVEASPAVCPVNVECEGGALDVEPVQHEDRGHHPGQALRIKRLQMLGDHLNTYRKTGRVSETVGGETNLDVGAAQVGAAEPDGVLRVGAWEEVLGELRRPVHGERGHS